MPNCEFVPLMRGTTDKWRTRIWQSFLGLPQTGVFDERMEQAVIAWQSKHGLPACGICGKKSEDKRIELQTCPTEPSYPAFSSSVPPGGDSKPPPDAA